MLKNRMDKETKRKFKANAYAGMAKFESDEAKKIMEEFEQHKKDSERLVEVKGDILELMEKYVGVHDYEPLHNCDWFRWLDVCSLVMLEGLKADLQMVMMKKQRQYDKFVNEGETWNFLTSKAVKISSRDGTKSL